MSLFRFWHVCGLHLRFVNVFSAAFFVKFLGVVDVVVVEVDFDPFFDQVGYLFQRNSTNPIRTINAQKGHIVVIFLPLSPSIGELTESRKGFRVIFDVIIRIDVIVISPRRVHIDHPV